MSQSRVTEYPQSILHEGTWFIQNIVCFLMSRKFQDGGIAQVATILA